MVIINPKEADSKVGTSGTDEVVVSGDLWGSGNARPVNHVPTVLSGLGGCLPRLVTRGGAESLEYANLLPLIGREPLGEESDD